MRPARVVEVRLDSTDATRLKPHAVRLVVLHQAEPTGAVKVWFDDWYDVARRLIDRCRVRYDAELAFPMSTLRYERDDATG
jgi:hypothetical protein